MKKLLSIFVLLCGTLHADIGIMGQHCGTRGTLIGTIASEFVIPDYFPPEQFLLRISILLPWADVLATCETEYAPVNLGESCLSHDQCYATLGATKDSCDDTLLQGWQQACNDGYAGDDETSSLCRNTCHDFADLMYTALRYQDAEFCPSCIAFDNAQANARLDSS